VGVLFFFQKEKGKGKKKRKSDVYFLLSTGIEPGPTACYHRTNRGISTKKKKMVKKATHFSNFAVLVWLSCGRFKLYEAMV